MNSIPVDSLEPPYPPDECPISVLLGKRVTQMTDEELEEHVRKIRAARESPQIMRSLLAGKTRKAKAPPAKPDLKLLDL